MGATAIQQAIARIHEACQAPPLSPPEYRILFEVLAVELNTNGLAGAQTLVNITSRAKDLGLDIRRDDLRFVIDVVSEADPWFEQGASANLFASRFRNFVVARCRSQGLSLSADELDLIEAWFNGAAPAQRAAPSRSQPPATAAPPQAQGSSDRWWNLEESRQAITEQRGSGTYGAEPPVDEFPRIVRSRLRG